MKFESYLTGVVFLSRSAANKAQGTSRRCAKDTFENLLERGMYLLVKGRIASSTLLQCADLDKG